MCNIITWTVQKEQYMKRYKNILYVWSIKYRKGNGKWRTINHNKSIKKSLQHKEEKDDKNNNLFKQNDNDNSVYKNKIIIIIIIIIITLTSYHCYS